MKTINGLYASANIFTDHIEDYAISQIQMLCDNPASKGSTIRIMPDVHPGNVGVIGLTMTVRDCVMPNIVGVDIGCGMTLAKIKQKNIEFQKLDTVIREHVPSGTSIRKKPHHFADDFDLSKLRCYKHIQETKALLSLGSLGGGNHFIEVNKGEDGSLYIVIHTGSRHLGYEVSEYYLSKGNALLKKQGIDIPYPLTYLTGALMEDYIHDLQIVQEFASLNRDVILNELCKRMKLKITDTFSCLHNYLTPFDQGYLLRKGAISATEGEQLIIPVNMRDGIILATGKGNPNWNFSAPHGSGRLYKREDVKHNYTVSQFKSEMKGIYCSCIGSNTLDEAPFAYRNLEEIQQAIGETATINQILKPIYNFKAGGNG